MKFKKLILLFVFLISLSNNFFAQKKSNWAFDLTTQGAYYTKTNYVKGNNHFAPLSNIYSTIELKTTFNANYKISTPLGNHFLLKPSNIIINSGLEICPVTIRPVLSVKFTPLPFIIIESGASIGTGWGLFGMQGLAILDKEKLEYNNGRIKESSIDYKDCTPFVDYYYYLWTKGTFQFDTGAIIQGDWTHVIMQLSYTVNYSGLTSADKNDIWLWQTANNKANGFGYQFDYLLAYQMPIFINMAGIMGDVFGYYDSDSYGDVGDSYNGSYKTVDISPFLKFNITKNDSLFTLFNFRCRRSFNQDHNSQKEEIFMEQTGDEWFFYRIAFNWIHNF